MKMAMKIDKLEVSVSEVESTHRTSPAWSTSNGSDFEDFRSELLDMLELSRGGEINQARLYVHANDHLCADEPLPRMLDGRRHGFKVRLQLISYDMTSPRGLAVYEVTTM